MILHYSVLNTLQQHDQYNILHLYTNQYIIEYILFPCKDLFFIKALLQIYLRQTNLNSFICQIIILSVQSFDINLCIHFYQELLKTEILSIQRFHQNRSLYARGSRKNSSVQFIFSNKFSSKYLESCNIQIEHIERWTDMRCIVAIKSDKYRIQNKRWLIYLKFF